LKIFQLIFSVNKTNRTDLVKIQLTDSKDYSQS